MIMSIEQDLQRVKAERDAAVKVLNDLGWEKYGFGWGITIAPPLESENGLTIGERECLNSLAEAWNIFNRLGEKHHDDNAEFRHAIHALQCLIAWRVARRVNPEVWA